MWEPRVTDSSLHTDKLADLCADETTRFMRHEANDPHYCFELLRRALVDSSGDALTHVYRIYEPLVLSWVRRHERFQHTGEDASYFASLALRNFYFAVRGAKFSNFQFLPQILRYLKRCVHSAIEQYLRDQQPTADSFIENIEQIGDATPLESELEAEDLWMHILTLIPEPEDQLLARLTFILDMKPAEIVRGHSSIWAHERAVSVALQRIRRRLRGDEFLRQAADESR